MWVYVRRRFQGLLSNLALTQAQLEDGYTKAGGIVSTLNSAIYDEADARKNAFIVGSWGKGTAVRPPTDLDLFFLLPASIWREYQLKTGNKQSQLLQYVRGILLNRYSQTSIRGDGQVVVVGFNTLVVEVVPAFPIQGGGYYICDTNDGGTWKAVDSDQELIEMNVLDDRYIGNVRKLSKIIKQWQRHCNVPIKGFHIEQVVKEMLASCTFSERDEYWFDWLVRDFFRFLLARAGGGFYMPGDKAEWISLGTDWVPKAQTAYANSLSACAYENNDMEASAGLEWQKIFGNMVPVTV